MRANKPTLNQFLKSNNLDSNCITLKIFSSQKNSKPTNQKTSPNKNQNNDKRQSKNKTKTKTPTNQKTPKHTNNQENMAGSQGKCIWQKLRKPRHGITSQRHEFRCLTSAQKAKENNGHSEKKFEQYVDEYGIVINREKLYKIQSRLYSWSLWLEPFSRGAQQESWAVETDWETKGKIAKTNKQP